MIMIARGMMTRFVHIAEGVVILQIGAQVDIVVIVESGGILGVIVLVLKNCALQVSMWQVHAIAQHHSVVKV